MIVDLLLKPCPFCGSDAEMLDWQDSNSSWDRNWAVNCFVCGIEMPSAQTELEATTLWNTRHEMQS